MSIEQSVLDKIQRERGMAYEGATVTPWQPATLAAHDAGAGSLWLITHPAQNPLYAVASHRQIFIMASAPSARALLHQLTEAESVIRLPKDDQVSFASPLLKKNTSHRGHPNTRFERP